MIAGIVSAMAACRVPDRGDDLLLEGQRALLSGDHTQAKARFVEAREFYRALKTEHGRVGEASATASIGLISYVRGDYRAAIASMQPALALFDSLGKSMPGEAWKMGVTALTDAGASLSDLGEADRSLALHSRAVAALEAMRADLKWTLYGSELPPLELSVRKNRAVALMRLGKYDDALQELKTAYERGSLESRSTVVAEQALCVLSKGDIAAARKTLSDYEGSISRKLDSTNSLAYAIVNARVLEAEDRQNEALSLLKKTSLAQNESEEALWVADWLKADLFDRLGDTASSQRERGKALDVLTRRAEQIAPADRAQYLAVPVFGIPRRSAYPRL